VKRYHERPREELYDLRTDPHEQRNLAAIRNTLRASPKCARKLDTWMKAQGDQRTVFQEPRLLSEPASYAPVTNPRPPPTRAGESPTECEESK